MLVVVWGSVWVCKWLWGAVGMCGSCCVCLCVGVGVGVGVCVVE